VEDRESLRAAAFNTEVLAFEDRRNCQQTTTTLVTPCVCEYAHCANHTASKQRMWIMTW